jgi:hypothetical protein
MGESMKSSWTGERAEFAKLHRHDRRKIVPDKRHPKPDADVQDVLF